MIIYVYLTKTTVAVTLRYVGRKHQPELLKRSVAQDCLPFMSRDHFNISFSRGLFHIRTMTSNPIWRFRSGNEPIELQRGDPVDLQTGREKERNLNHTFVYTWISYLYKKCYINCASHRGKNLIELLRLNWNCTSILVIQFFASLVVLSGDRIALGTGNVGTLRWSSYARSGNPWRLKSQH